MSPPHPVTRSPCHPVTGSLSLRAPSDPGQYEFRYLPNDGYTDAARSNTVTVQAAILTLTAAPATAAPGADLTVSWNVSAPGRNDWIGLYRVGAPNSPFLAIRYT